MNDSEMGFHYKQGRYKNLYQEDSGFDLINAVIKTKDIGEIGIRLYTEYAPDSVASFCNSVKEEFYDGLLWFLCQEGYVIQTGCPDNKHLY